LTDEQNAEKDEKLEAKEKKPKASVWHDPVIVFE
jgi:hypothetical protein